MPCSVGICESMYSAISLPYLKITAAATTNVITEKEDYDVNIFKYFAPGTIEPFVTLFSGSVESPLLAPLAPALMASLLVVLRSRFVYCLRSLVFD